MKSLQIPVPLSEHRRIERVAACLKQPMGRLFAPYIAIGLAELETRLEVEIDEADAR